MGDLHLGRLTVNATARRTVLLPRLMGPAPPRRRPRDGGGSGQQAVPGVAHDRLERDGKRINGISALVTSLARTTAQPQCVAGGICLYLRTYECPNRALRQGVVRRTSMGSTSAAVDLSVGTPVV
jgi:hypothetical protein